VGSVQGNGFEGGRIHEDGIEGLNPRKFAAENGNIAYKNRSSRPFIIGEYGIARYESNGSFLNAAGYFLLLLAHDPRIHQAGF
jgi:hypothetical protein